MDPTANFRSMQRIIDAARGKIPCDWTIEDVNYLDVFTCEWRRGDISWIDEKIVGIDPGLKASRKVSGSGMFVVPGFIDSHVHVESSLLTPWNFEKLILPKGTTTAICDPHEIANVVGTKGIQYFLDSAAHLHLDLFVMLSSCVPATAFETNGAGNITLKDLLPLKSHPKTLGLAEVMNFPGVLNLESEVISKILNFSIPKDEIRGRFHIDGHCPLLTGLDLSAYAAAGITSCHESSNLEEAREKLTKGLAVWIREGSVAKDLKTLIPLLNSKTSPNLGFCTDDRNPKDILSEGHIDHLIRSAIALGTESAEVYRSASWSVARHYGLKFHGAIAPGYFADIVLINDLNRCGIQTVFKRGRPISEIPFGQRVNEQRIGNSVKDFVLGADGLGSDRDNQGEIASRAGLDISETDFTNSVRANVPEECDLMGPEGESVHVIEVLPGKIITEHQILSSQSSKVKKLSVLERYGHHSKPANAYVLGFGENLNGAIASSVGHDSHNLIVVGSNTKDMRVSLARLIESRGGFCVVSNGKSLASLPLPIGGLMTSSDPNEVSKKLEELQAAAKFIGCELEEPFLQLAFLSLPVIPKLKLTDKGLFDVTQFKIIGVRAD